jgi:uncharacterized protein YbbC (DUF1343 family)
MPWLRILIVLLVAGPLLGRVKTGLDILVEQKFALLAGKRVGVVTNHSALSYDGRHLVDVLLASGNVKLACIFSPEHGFAGTLQGSVPSGKHAKAGVPIYSLHDQGSYRPRQEALQGLDALVFDIQDVGARFYTFITTLGYAMEEAAKARVPVMVLDRPNPINGVAVEGPLLEAAYESFVGYSRIPVRHGMTVGELARFYNAEKRIHADLTVVEMQGWRRAMWFDETGLPWVNPSPAMISLHEAVVYPGTCLLDGPATSAGRGTPLPFQWIGAPWLKSREIAEYMNGRDLPGLRFLARRFVPTESHHARQECDGIELIVVDRNAVRPVVAGLEMVAAILKFHPGKLDVETSGFARRLGNAEAIQRLKRGDDPRAIGRQIEAETARFREQRRRYLIYR